MQYKAPDQYSIKQYCKYMVKFEKEKTQVRYATYTDIIILSILW